MIIGCTAFSGILYTIHEQDMKYKSDPGNFYKYAHLVKIHISPEHEGIGVVALASDKFPPTTGRTDNNSEVMFPMISSEKYNILVDNNRCSYYIYPVESEYYIHCGD